MYEHCYPNLFAIYAKGLFFGLVTQSSSPTNVREGGGLRDGLKVCLLWSLNKAARLKMHKTFFLCRHFLALFPD